MSSSDLADQTTMSSPRSGVSTGMSGLTAVNSSAQLVDRSFDPRKVDERLFIKLYDSQKILDVMKHVAVLAGRMMLSADVTKIDTKNNTSDLVTETDKAIEAMIKSELLTAFPNFEFFGEETSKGDQKLSEKPTFVIDPIDGTLNFTHGIPNCAVSIAVVYALQPVAGVIYKPATDEMWSAVIGKGAHKESPELNAERRKYRTEIERLTIELSKMKRQLQGEQPEATLSKEFLSTSPTDERTQLPLRSPTALGPLNKSLMAIEWGNERSGYRWALRSALHKSLLSAPGANSPKSSMIQSIRSMGSAALNFCYVAEGRLDAFWEPGCKVWDVAAGWIILKETGGVVWGVNRGDFEPSVEGRMYFAIRGAGEQGRESQVAFAEAVWAKLEGDFNYDEGIKKDVLVKATASEDGEEEADGLEMKAYRQQLTEFPPILAAA